ncbi:MAG: hypothetical protein GY754_33580 [bacterium]|nr:hypothetical protein [bacterium]
MKILNKIKTMMEKPEKAAEQILREMNENIPKMNSDIASLRQKIAQLEEENTGLNSKKENLLQKKELAQKTGQESLVTSIEESLSVIEPAVKRTTMQLEGLQTGYIQAFEAMRAYIQKKKQELQEALVSVDTNKRGKLQTHCTGILEKFEAAVAQADRRATNREDRERKEEIKGDINISIEKKVEEGYKKIGELRRICSLIEKEQVKQKLEEVINLSEKILERLKTHPREIKNTRVFLTYYLDTIIKILEGYIDLSEEESMGSSMEKVEKILGTIQSTFEKIHSKMLVDDILTLDTEIEVLERVLTMEE